MAQTPPSNYTVFQGLECPECHMAQGHIHDVYTGTGINAFGRSDERVGVKILMACEANHAYIVGLGNHKGDAFIYVRLPLGAEIEKTTDYYAYAAIATFRFTGKHDFAWHPKATSAPGQTFPLEGGMSALDSGLWS